MNRLIACALGGALCLVPMACRDDLAGSAGTGNAGKGTITGRVLGPDGKGVAGARVTVVGSDHNPGPGGSGDVDAIAVTESDGRFRTDSLPDGLYNLLGAKGSQVAFLDSVAVAGDSGSRASDATLKAPGSAKGVIRLRPGDDSRTVFLILIGTTTFTVPRDPVGNFDLAGLAEGEYRLRILSTLDAYPPMDTVIRVVSGQDAWLDTLRLASLDPQGLPIIDRPVLEYDSALIRTRISWNRQDPARVAAYNVYRRAEDSAYVLLNPAPLSDTFFVDRDIRTNQVYDYAVTVLDAQGNEGMKGRASAVLAGQGYTIGTAVESSDCGAGVCHFDVDGLGNVWLAELGGAVRKVPPAGPETMWRDSLASTWPAQIRADGSGGIYLLVGGPLRVAKFDTAGNRLWVKPLPFDRDVAFTLHLEGDTVRVWADEERVMTTLSPSGALVRQDTLLRSLAMDGMRTPRYDPGIGFYKNDFAGLAFLDGSGNETSRWVPEAHGSLKEVVRDPQGRWYILWGDGRIEVFGPDRGLARTLLLKGGVGMIHRGGAIYLNNFPEFPRSVLRILPNP